MVQVFTFASGLCFGIGILGGFIVHDGAFGFIALSVASAVLSALIEGGFFGT